MKTSWPSPAKLNLFLYITGQRKDGYHTLQTLFQFLNYGDTITIILNNSGQIRLLTPLKGVSNEENLIIRAAHLLMEAAEQNKHFSICKGVDIIIEKRLPIGSGLGGGSSNAATVLVALNQLWECGFNEEDLSILGLKLGADVPVFVHGHSAFAEGIGELLVSVSLSEKWYLIAYPGINIPTSLVFYDSELPRNKPRKSMETLLKCEFSNDCEIIVRKYFHKVDETLSWLLKYAPSRLTGTGSCVFAEFDTEYSAYQVLKQAPEWLYGFVAQGVNLSPLRQAVAKYTKS